MSATAKLTPRQKKILALLKKRKGDKDIALTLDISLRAAQYHVERLRRIYGYRSRRQFWPEVMIRDKQRK